MRFSRKYAVPAELSLLYDFVNSLDERRFVHRGMQHRSHDELATAHQLEHWMRSRGLLRHGGSLSPNQHKRALRLRDVLRDLLRCAPKKRKGDSAVANKLNELAAEFPLILLLRKNGHIELGPARAEPISKLAEILAQLLFAAKGGRLDRVKMCASEECRWIFYDRSKAGAQRWCVTALCGNREKTRAYRARRRGL